MLTQNTQRTQMDAEKNKGRKTYYLVFPPLVFFCVLLCTLRILRQGFVASRAPTLRAPF